MGTPRMYSWNLSPFAGKARIAFAFKNVDVDLIEIDPADRPQELRELNPTNRVPLLILEDGTPVRESTAICEWAEETGHGPSLWPSDPGQRAAARGLLRFVDDELTINFFLSMRKQAFGLEPGDPEDIVDVLRGRLVKRWPRVEDLLSRTEGTWMMGGGDPTLVDLAALPVAKRVAEWMPELLPDPDTAPKTAAWLEALRERPEADQVSRKGS